MCRPKYAMSSPVGTWMVDRVDLADVVCSDPNCYNKDLG